MAERILSDFSEDDLRRELSRRGSFFSTSEGPDDVHRKHTPKDGPTHPVKRVRDKKSGIEMSVNIEDFDPKVHDDLEADEPEGDVEEQPARKKSRRRDA